MVRVKFKTLRFKRNIEKRMRKKEWAEYAKDLRKPSAVPPAREYGSNQARR
jgi:hypothetical protein